MRSQATMFDGHALAKLIGARTDSRKLASLLRELGVDEPVSPDAEEITLREHGLALYFANGVLDAVQFGTGPPGRSYRRWKTYKGRLPYGLVLRTPRAELCHARRQAR